MKYFTIAFFLLFTLNVFSQEARPEMEIVETIPIETDLGNTDIRDAHAVWLEMINNAKQSLDFEQFYISSQKGEPLDDILTAIDSACQRGVKVRFIVDGNMYKTYPEIVNQWKAMDTASTQVPHPSARVLDFRKYGGGIQHAKYFIVDGEEIFFGSQNFDWRALEHIHELGIRLKYKDAVKPYQDVFNLDWQLAGTIDSATAQSLINQQNYSTQYQFVSDQNDTVSFNPTFSPKGYILDSTLWDETQILSLINNAQQEVELQFLTYSTAVRGKGYYPIIENALKAAADRGVRIKMIVADWGKYHPLVDSLQALSKVPNVELKYSNIPDWSGGYVSFARVEHCKYIVADGKSFWLGTSNCEKSYFYNVRNIGIVVNNIRLAGRLQNIFLKDWTGKYTEPITWDRTYTPREHGEKK